MTVKEKWESILEEIKEERKDLKKVPLKLVECFSGQGMQRRGLENSGLYNVESVATCETDGNVIISYAAIHCGLTEDMVDEYDKYPTRQEMADELKVMHINYDFVKDKEYDWDKLARSKDSKKVLQKTWLACKLSKNVGDISRVEEFPHCGFLTFSFPCTDLSIAGKQAGMVEGETRSGLVYEVLRIIKNMKKNGDAPNFLLMENVDALVNQKNIKQYEALNEEFKELGYYVSYKVMNGKFAGVPQNRKRIFALYSLKPLDNFEMPLDFDNELRLKDILLDEVDDKYYITSDKAQALLDELVLNGTLEE